MEKKQNWEKRGWSDVNSENDMIIEAFTTEDKAEVLKIGIKIKQNKQRLCNRVRFTKDKCKV